MNKREREYKQEPINKRHKVTTETDNSMEVRKNSIAIQVVFDPNTRYIKCRSVSEGRSILTEEQKAEIEREEADKRSLHRLLLSNDKKSNQK